MLLAIDIGGANLKAADGRGFSVSRFFPLWQRPNDLSAELASLIEAAPTARQLLITMTGELADCFETKTEGVRFILDAVERAAGDRQVEVFLVDGAFATLEDARKNPLSAAASNWRALAEFSARHAPRDGGLLIDIGSTTADIIPIIEGRPAATGKTDTDRLLAGELVYTGVTRSPTCAIVDRIPYRGEECPTAQELFSTSWDAYLVLGELPEDPQSTHTADGRPATRAAARARLARLICADVDSFNDEDAVAAAEAVKAAQVAQLSTAVQAVIRKMPVAPKTVVISGQGEFLARTVLERLRLEVAVVSLNEQLAPDLSRCATAHALAVLGLERAAQ